ncbi:MAG: IS21-like element helper ATPase IstB [bacterium]
MSIINEIELTCKKLKLGKNISDNIKKIELTDKYEFILKVLELEVERRELERRARNISSAGFYSIKTLSDYIFEDIKFPEILSKEDIKTVNFIKDKENIIMYGNPGTGKTHLAAALGLEACRKDLKVGFYRTSALVNKLIEAKKAQELGKLINKLSKLDMLILDEWGYVPLDREGAQLLFQVISDCYEVRSIIITTNLEFSKWITIFYDKEMTAAIIDRLVHHSHLLLFEGESFRVKHSLIRQ